MKRSGVCLFCIVWLCFFYFTPIGGNLSYAAKAGNERWSFDFQNCSISDALRQMSQVTSIDLFMNRNRGERFFSKFYENQTVDQILKDLFRREDYAMVWYYAEKSLDAIGIFIFESSGSGDNFDSTKFLRERRTSLRDNTSVKNVDRKSKVVKKQFQKTSGNSSFKTRTKPSSPGHSSSNHGIGKATPIRTLSRSEPDNQGSNVRDPGIIRDEEQSSGTTLPPPTSEKRHNLESPPMPPGFSYAK